MKKYIIITSLICNLVFALLVVRHFVLSPKKRGDAPLSYFVNGDQIFKELPKRSSDILFLGDSEFAAFRVEEIFGSLRVKNRGIYYDSSQGILARSKDIAVGKPSTVFILCGINDLEAGIEVGRIALNFKKTIHTLKRISPTTRIRILSVLPTNLKFGDKPHTIEPFRKVLNTQLCKICQLENIVYIDLDPVFLKDGGLNTSYDVGDKIHLNGLGYRKLAGIIKPYTGL